MNMFIFGASGFSREVADICLELGYSKITFIDNQVDEKKYFGFEIITEDEIEQINIEDCHFSIGIGEPSVRKIVYDKFPNLFYPTLIHPSATFGHKAKEAIKTTKGNIITAGVRMTNNIKFGNFGIYNLNVTVGHDCIINDFVTISPGANISGNVKIQNGAYIGTGSTVLQGKSLENKIVIGERATVGAGAVVIKNVPANVTVKGIPAK